MTRLPEKCHTQGLEFEGDESLTCPVCKNQMEEGYDCNTEGQKWKTLYCEDCELLIENVDKFKSRNIPTPDADTPSREEVLKALHKLSLIAYLGDASDDDTISELVNTIKNTLTKTL